MGFLFVVRLKTIDKARVNRLNKGGEKKKAERNLYFLKYERGTHQKTICFAGYCFS